MSKIDELIAELCPEGVRCSPLSKLILLQRGERVTKNDLLSDGPVPVVSGGKGYMGFVGRSNREMNTITIAQYGAAGYVAWQKLAFWANDVCFSAVLTTDLLQYRFLYHFLKSRQEVLYSISNRVAVPHSIDAKRLLSITIPLPPLEVQREIVSILDKFTQLEAELEAELEARRSQYEHTRDQLLDFSGDLGSHPLSELIAEFCPEGVPIALLGDAVINRDNERRPVTRELRQSGIYPYYGANGVQDYVQDFIFDGEFLLVGEDGSVIEASGVPVLNWAEGKIWVNNHAHVLQERTGGPVLRFLYFYLSTINVSAFVTGGSQKKINQGNLNKIPIPLPPLEVQREIVSILDKLDALVNDLTFGLPAEISARRKQYEYYRNQLLTFKELETA
jgi:type I restriction enzyme S subunit